MATLYQPENANISYREAEELSEFCGLHPSELASFKTERGGSWAVGTPDEAATTIRAYADAGIDMIVLQDFLPHDLDYIDLLGALAQEWA